MFDEFFKPRRPKYTRGKEIRQIDIPIEVSNSLEYEIKLSYDQFKTADDFELISIIKSAIKESMNVLNLVKIEDFDSIGFKRDLFYLLEK